MTIGWSAFTTSEPRTIIQSIADLLSQPGAPKMSFHLAAPGSTAPGIEDSWAKLGLIKSRYAYQSSPVLRKQLNEGNVEYSDIHVSKYPLDMVSGFFRPIDLFMVEASEILEDGSFVPSSGVGCTPEMMAISRQVLIEINTGSPSFRGMHDILPPWKAGESPIPITKVAQRVGGTSLRIDPSKVVGIVEGPKRLHGAVLSGSDEPSRRIAGHLMDFFENEVKHGRLPENLAPLQSGVGNVGNAVFESLGDSRFGNLEAWTEVAQDSFLSMVMSGKVRAVSATALPISQWDFFFDHIERFRQHIVLRPQRITNSPEMIRRLGVIGMNTPIDIDIYGHANSTHIGGTRMMNGLGGSNDFERNCFLSIMHVSSTRPTAKDPTGVSSVVPMCPHIDQTEHDLDVFVTEQGLADLRGLSPVKRARVVIEKCAHPSYRDQLSDYLNLAIRATQPRGAGHEPQVLSKVFKMYENLEANDTMHLASW